MFKKFNLSLFMAAIITVFMLSNVPAAFCAGMPDNVAGKNIEEPAAPPEGLEGPPPPPECAPGGPGGPPMMGKNKGQRPDFLKNLTPEQREEAKKFMMLGKSYNDLADVYAEQGKVEEAVATLKKLAEMKIPSYLPAEHRKDKQKMVNMRIVQLYLKCGKDAQALAEAEKLIKSGDLGVEEQAHLYSMMGNAYKKKGETEKAGEMLKKTIELLENSVKK
ncbi:MAG: Tetratricopeptide repeat protein [bacterium ADurb.Bin243]|mgnify:CR=1 FL=1|nr:MAG: Tetratricopeptide repeat protein [bacterium ADurb.Bin243]